MIMLSPHRWGTMSARSLKTGSGMPFTIVQFKFQVNIKLSVNSYFTLVIKNLDLELMLFSNFLIDKI